MNRSAVETPAVYNKVPVYFNVNLRKTMVHWNNNLNSSFHCRVFNNALKVIQLQLSAEV